MKKASLIFLVIVLLFAAFTAGLFCGRNLGGTRLSISVADTEASTPTQTAAPLTAVPDPSSAPSQPATDPSAPTDPGLLNINTATVQQLCELPGIGEVLAQRIIDYRTESGSFGSIYELTEVEGIGEKKMAAIEELITTGG